MILLLAVLAIYTAAYLLGGWVGVGMVAVACTLLLIILVAVDVLLHRLEDAKTRRIAMRRLAALGRGEYRGS